MMSPAVRFFAAFLALLLVDMVNSKSPLAQEASLSPSVPVSSSSMNSDPALPTALMSQSDTNPDLEVDETVTDTVVRENELLSYCFNISDDARELRAAIVNERLVSISKEIDDKLATLHERIELLKAWLDKRQSFLTMTNETMVQVYQKMRPDAAALQLMEMDPVLSASLIVKLEAKVSSAIMVEMKPKAAARITELLAAAKNAGREAEDVN